MAKNWNLQYFVFDKNGDLEESCSIVCFNKQRLYQEKDRIVDIYHNHPDFKDKGMTLYSVHEKKILFQAKAQ